MWENFSTFCYPRFLFLILKEILAQVFAQIQIQILLFHTLDKVLTILQTVNRKYTN